jgi:hypothetical protein
MLKSWAMLQMVLNVVLFVPLGFIMRQLYNFGPLKTMLLGLVLSFGIETTQWSGNWGLALCAYRYPDVNDLITNTTGALLGGLLAMLLPRFTADARSLEGKRSQPRPLTRTRRFTGMFFDALYLGVLYLGIVATEAAAVVLGQAIGLSQSRQHVITSGFLVVQYVGIFALIFLPALFGSGASLGQRTVYLRPVPRNGSRARLVLRAFIVQGLFMATMMLPDAPSGWPEWANLLINAVYTVGWLVVPVSLVWVLFDPTGFSCRLSGCQLEDSREVNEVPTADHAG